MSMPEPSNFIIIKHPHVLKEGLVYCVSGVTAELLDSFLMGIRADMIEPVHNYDSEMFHRAFEIY